MPKKLTNEEFIKRCIKTHGSKYDYSLVKYINKRTKVQFICKEHGIFEQLPLEHSNGIGCYICFNGGKGNTIDLIKKSKLIHDNKYDYSLVDYKTSKIKVKIICPIHGIFEQKPNYHLNGNGCIKCSGRYNKKEEFENNSNKIHNNKYDYSLVDYKNNKTKVKIICPIHGIFEQRPDNHIHGYGCFFCKESKGELYIENILKENNIKYIREYKFNDCKNINLLSFDFYLFNLNICIEYDGGQHFNSVNFFGGMENLKKTQKRDQIKNEYCKNNNIRLIRIKYDESIEEKLKEFI